MIDTYSAEWVSFDRTYEELKQFLHKRLFEVHPRFDRTYEELKLFLRGGSVTDE